MGTLERRLRALHRAVTEYVYGLIELALDLVEKRPGVSGGEGLSDSSSVQAEKQNLKKLKRLAK